MVRRAILAMYVILVGKLQDSHLVGWFEILTSKYGVSCSFVVTNYSSFGWGRFPQFPFQCECSSWMTLDFVKCVCCVSWYNHVIFLFQSVDVRYHINWFLTVEPALHNLGISQLFRVYNAFTHHWIRFTTILLRTFTFMFMRNIELQFLFLQCLSLVLILGWCWPHKIS